MGCGRPEVRAMDLIKMSQDSGPYVQLIQMQDPWALPQVSLCHSGENNSSPEWQSLMNSAKWDAIAFSINCSLVLSGFNCHNGNLVVFLRVCTEADRFCDANAIHGAVEMEWQKLLYRCRLLAS